MEFYTKAVLTVIAGALVVLCVQNGMGAAYAGFDVPEAQVQKVTICVESTTSKGYVCGYGAADKALKLTH
jgi:hypothetical protein